MIELDYHMHTKRCGHATGEVEEYVAEAKKKKLKEIGFSDHLPFVTHRDAQYTMDLPELPDYHRDIERARDRHAAELTIKIGIEADYMEGQTGKIGKLLSEYPYDFVIGSVHFIKKWAFDDPREQEKWKNANVDEISRRYYDLLKAAAGAGIYDIMGHVDLVKKFGHRSSEDLTPLVEEAGEAFKKAGVSVEINTSGLRKPVKEIYPTPAILKIYRRHGVPITFSSDAHAPGDVGADFDQAASLAREAGYKEYVSYSKRKIERTIPL